MLAYTRKKLDLYLHVGDMAYGRGTHWQFTNRFFKIYEDILNNTPIWPTLGNHEGITSFSQTQQGPYFDSYSLPKGGESGGLPSGTEAYYSFDYSNIHFIVLDSYHSSTKPGSAMVTWLEEDLKDHTSTQQNLVKVRKQITKKIAKQQKEGLQWKNIREGMSKSLSIMQHCLLYKEPVRSRAAMPSLGVQAGTGSWVWGA